MLILSLILAVMPAVVYVQTGPSASTPTPTPPAMMPLPADIFARPTLPAQPSQADLGSQVYWLHCMVCHGDHGEGLTDEYRAAWPKVDQNCWQARCHGDPRNPESFALPKYVPPLIGPGALSHFQTAASLYGFIKTSMPFQAPGSLQDQEYWELTAFLARANGAHLPGPILDSGAAAAIDLHPPSPRAVPWWIPAIAACVLFAVAFAVYRRARARRV
jgi:cytochrome c